MRRQQVKRVRRGVQMFRASDRQVCLHGGTQRIHMTVGVPSREIAPPLGERIKIFVIEVLRSQGFIALARPALERQKQIF